MRVIVYIAVGLLISPLCYGLSCIQSENDPYELLDALYERSELVFIGSPITDIFEDFPTKVRVESIWKGPNLDQIDMSAGFSYRKPRIIFASRRENSPGWYELSPACIFLPNGDSFEAAMHRAHGDPIPSTPSLARLDPTEVMFVSIIFVALGGIGYLVWSLRDV